MARLFPFTAAVLSLLLPPVSPCGLAQLSSGTVKGSVPTAIARLIPSIRITLEEVTTSSLLGSTTPDAEGDFVFRNVPFATYDVTAIVGGAALFQQRFDLRSAVPYTVFFDSTRTYHAAEIVVEGVPRLTDRSAGSTTTHSLYTAGSIASLPSAGAAKSIEAILLNTPGVVPDEDGRLHVRGEDAQLQYVVDGIPITGNLTRVYSSLFNAAFIKSVDIQTGGLNPEYGIATSGVLAITTKSGFDRPLFARLAGMGGSFGNREVLFEAGGNLGGASALYVAGSTSSSDRYLDPITDGSPMHAGGASRSLFGNFTGVINGDIAFTLLGMVNATGYSIPNSVVKTPVQDQRQQLEDYLVGARFSGTLGPRALVSALVFRRRSQASVTSGGMSRLTTATEIAQALAQNEKMFIGGSRDYTTTGGQIEFSARFEGASTDQAIKAGVGAEHAPVNEFFTFAVTNPSLADTSLAGGDARFLPYDMTRGGRPFIVDQSKTGSRLSVFLQDELRTGALTVSGGVRYDVFRLIETESAFSPRIAAALALDEKTTLRASYNRIVMQPPVENYLVSSSTEARTLAGGAQRDVPTNVRSERAHVFELGAAHRVNDVLDADLAGYAKFIDNFIANVELGNSGVIFPVNLKQGFVAGGELRVRLHEWNNLSGFLSLSTCVSRGVVPSDGSSPIAAGLVFGEEGGNYANPFKGEDTFPTEHNQLLTAAFGLTYTFDFGLAATVGGRVDSGLPFDLTGPDGQPLDEAGSRAELLRRGYSERIIGLLDLAPETAGSPDRTVAPHAIIDASVSYDFGRLSAVPMRVSLTALNLFDTLYLYKFESTFGGTHMGLSRSLMARLELEL